MRRRRHRGAGGPLRRRPRRGPALTEGPEAPAPEPTLPDAVRRRVVELAATALPALPDDRVPAPLRRVRSFAPARRASAGAAPIATALARDVTFRQEVAAAVRAADPELAEALESGTPPAAADPVEVAAAAYLLRPAGWADHVEAAADVLQQRDHQATAAQAQQEADRLRAAVEEARAEAQSRTQELAERLAAQDEELTALRRELRRQRADADRARAAARSAEDEARQAAVESRARVEQAESALARAVREAAEARQALEALRRADKEGRSLAGARARLLLDTLADAAAGLRRELNLPAVAVRPADLVGEEPSLPSGATAATARAQAADDPAALDTLLSLPQVHLVVDGYNVTKAAYGTLTLEEQRRRLVAGLGTLAARTGAEVTCCFDGAALEGRVTVPQVRGVRVRFSPPGQTADEMIRRLVAAEPQGRVVVVVSSDREVAHGVAARGARPVASAALARLLDRG